MQVLFGVILLIVVLALLSLFKFKAPGGDKAVSALSSAAIASFLVEAFHSSFLGSLFGIDFLSELGSVSGSLSGVAAGALVAFALDVKPVYAVMIGLAAGGYGILPGFFAGYLTSYVVKFLDEKIPEGLNLIAIVLAIPFITRLLAIGIDPIVKATLLRIGDILVSAADTNPIVMGVILGAIIPVVSTTPLSSMALTAILGLTGTPMAIGALATMGASFTLLFLFHFRRFGSNQDTISVAIEPLTQIDVTLSNPLPIWSTVAAGGALSGVVIALMGLVNNTPGTATPIAGFAVMFAYNDFMQVIIAALIVILISSVAGFIGAKLYRNYPIQTAQEIRSAAK
ncbi:MAG: PTS sugar transporter subunit IIC [Aerococcus suis]|nr:PTS sugar transporter subunit IIC [Aerococcus suis]MDD7758066.1 PTS sugar transporter subunit IIC [Aerococcus suis]